MFQSYFKEGYSGMVKLLNYILVHLFGMHNLRNGKRNIGISLFK